MTVIVVINQDSVALGRAIAEQLKGKLFGLESRCSGADATFSDVGKFVREQFEQGNAIIAIMASGAVIRLLAGNLDDKQSEPAVIAVAPDGSSVVPLLGGHRGANELAKQVAKITNGFAAITTASDVRFGVALDAPPEGWVLANPEDYKAVAANILGGEEVRLQGRFINGAEWLMNSKLPIDDDGTCTLSISETARPAMPGELIYNPKRHVIGIGCERGTSSKEVIELIDTVINERKLARGAIACIASIDVKADEYAIHAAGAHFGVPVRFFEASRLEQESPRLANPSEVVFAEVGCHGVAEGAALAGAGPDSDLIVEKNKSKRATVAIAKSSEIVDPDKIGRARGNLFVVGIGPGQQAWRSPEVSAMIGQSTDLVGYSLYLDLISDISAGKIRHDFDLGKEEDRVRHAMELAGQGKQVALVCSGDAGIYAMATLVFELIENGGLSDGALRIGIEVSPGISALQGAAARAGAPLGHDFCTISLSDLLTPWDAIQKRVKAAAEGDFVIAFYNPVSKRRRTQLAHAKEVLLDHRPEDTPVILASNLGRYGETVRVVPLSELNIDDVDMLTVVIVGSSETKTARTGDGRTWVYTPRGYSGKEGTGIKA